MFDLFLGFLVFILFVVMVAFTNPENGMKHRKKKVTKKHETYLKNPDSFWKTGEAYITASFWISFKRRFWKLSFSKDPWGTTIHIGPFKTTIEW